MNSGQGDGTSLTAVSREDGSHRRLIPPPTSTVDNVQQVRANVTKKRLLVAAAAIPAIAMAAVVVAAFLFVHNASQPGETTARFIPSDAAVYVSINLRPGIEQMRLRNGVFATDAFEEARDQAFDEIDDGIGVHFRDDVLPWLGDEISWTLLDIDSDQPDWVLLAHVRDHAAALDFVEDLLAFYENEDDTVFETGAARGADIWIAEDGSSALGLTDHYLIVSGDEDTVRDMVRNLESPPARPLAGDEVFIAARQSVPRERVMFAFARTGPIVDALAVLTDPLGDQLGVLGDVDAGVGDYVAASASFISHGVRVDLVAPDPSETFVLDDDGGLKSLGVLPEDTLLLFATRGIGEIWDEFDQSFAGLGEIDQLLEGFDEQIGIEIDDIIESLTGEIAVAVLPSDLEGVFFGGDSEDGPPTPSINALLLVGAAETEAIERALGGLMVLLGVLGFDIDRSSLGDYEIVSARPAQPRDFIGLEPGYIIAEDWVTVGTTLESLEAFHETVSGTATPLSSASEFARMTNLLSGPLHSVVFVDIAGIAAMVEDALDDGTLEDYNRDARPFIEPFSAFLMASSTTDDAVRSTMVLTLRDEPAGE